ncbi:hypothetical protein CPT_Phriendly_002 [Vibrio phage Phriendly]|nr:hypothetical protein CPT_Phriendly_002 [Vibrio phage Phriendly]
MNKMLKDLANAIAAFKSSSRGVVVCVEAILEQYGKDFQASNLEAACELLKRQPRLRSAYLIILKELGTVKFTKGKGDTYTVKNKEDVSKKDKARARLEIKKFIEAEYTSLLNFKKVKVTVEYDWSKKQASFKTQAQNALNHGVTKEELIKMINSLEAQKVEETEAA